MTPLQLQNLAVLVLTEYQDNGAGRLGGMSELSSLRLFGLNRQLPPRQESTETAWFALASPP